MKYILIFIFTIISLSLKSQVTHTVFLDDLNMKTFSEGIPSISVKQNGGGDSIRIHRKIYKRGVGVQSLSVLTLLLNQHAKSFRAEVGPDDRANGNNTYDFIVMADRSILFQSGPMKVGDEAKNIDVDLRKCKRLGLIVLVKDERGQQAMGNWADARVEMFGNAVPINIPNDDKRFILTPKEKRTPRINSPKVFGATPGNPIFYYIAVSGLRPIHYKTSILPEGLNLDAKTGIISGNILKKGNYKVLLQVANALGNYSQTVTFKIGDTISLTPPIGWNGWNSWAKEIDQSKVIASANAMVKMGLRDHGWNYVNIDDAWQGIRGGIWNAIQPNEKFPAFKNMVDNIHKLGMRVGLYSTPWITSYAGFVGGSSPFSNGFYPDSIKNNKRAFRNIGSYRFEEQDAKQMAVWGVDYLKYDWRIELKSAERMSEALKRSGRDIHFSISNSAPFAQVNDWIRMTNSHRTGPDIRDSWTSLYLCAFNINKWSPYGGPGHWNDPDMMIVGNVTTGSNLHPTRLTPDEQYSHVSIFSLLATPILIGCPIEQLDAFTLNLLTNDEVIEINQDPLGKPAKLMSDENGIQVYLKSLENGDFAIGIFNTANWGQNPQSFIRWGDEKPLEYTLDISKLGLKGKYSIRDVWRQKIISKSANSISLKINHHGVQFLRVSKNDGKANAT